MYSKGFTNPYPSGWENLPSEDTPVTAEALQAHTDAIEHIDDYLFDNQIESKADADIVANEFDMATTYNENDYFMYEGILYKVLVTCQGVEPPDEDFYQPTLISDEFGSGGGSANIAYGTTEQFNAQKESAPVGTTFLVTDDSSGGGTTTQYKANWTGANSTATGTRLTDSLMLPPGKYIVIIKTPYSINASAQWALTLQGAPTFSSAFIHNSYGSAVFQFELSNQTEIYVVSGSSLYTMTWDSSFFDRGGLFATRFD